VFANLALNAFEAMPEGGELKIITRQDEGFAEVIFQDTGEGIGDEILKNIFEPLYTTKTKGTGLGLAVCQQVVAKHQGTIQASSQKGIGSIFTVRLPLPGSENPTSKELV
jgi:signal transduction histidine kinase